MTRILYWNVGKSTDPLHTKNACIENDADILIIAESEFLPSQLLSILNAGQSRLYFSISLNVARLRIFTRYDLSFLETSYEDRHTAVLHFSPPIGQSLIIVAIHLPSKMHQDEEGQYHRVRLLSQEITRAEAKYQHSRTAVIGDFNLNPFEIGMIAADGFQAVMDKNTSLKNIEHFNLKTINIFIILCGADLATIQLVRQGHISITHLVYII